MKIARIHKVTWTHVTECAKGNREGRPNLTETIRRYQEKAQLVAMNHTDAATAA